MKKFFYSLMTYLASVLIILIAAHSSLTKNTESSFKLSKAKAGGEALPIDASAKMSPAHPEYDLSMSCAECHPTTLDAISNATTLYVNNLKELKQDEIWKKIEAFLPGRERFVLATSYHNKPTATTIDFVLDPVEKISYAGVQIEGRAEVVFSSDPRFETYLDKYQLVRLSKERAKKRMDVLRVTIKKVMFFDSTLLKSGFSPYQMWERRGGKN